MRDQVWKEPLWLQNTISTAAAKRRHQGATCATFDLRCVGRNGQPAGARSSNHRTGPREILPLRSRQHPDIQSKRQTARRGGVPLSQQPRTRCAASRRDESDASRLRAARRLVRTGVGHLCLGDRGAGQGDGGAGQRVARIFRRPGWRRPISTRSRRARTGRNLMIAIGFEPISPISTNSGATSVPGTGFRCARQQSRPARSFADARH